MAKKDLMKIIKDTFKSKEKKNCITSQNIYEMNNEINKSPGKLKKQTANATFFNKNLTKEPHSKCEGRDSNPRIPT